MSEMCYQKYKSEGFQTPTGKFEIYSSVMEQAGVSPLPIYREPPLSPISTPELAKRFPLILMSGTKIRNFFHSELRQIKSLRRRNPDPLVEINPDTAASLGISEGEWVWIETQVSRVKMRDKLFDGIAPDVVNAQHAWWFPEQDPPEYGWKTSNVNLLYGDNHFDLRAGPIMGQIVLADEVNRATPKTQAALLEAMEERQVTVDGVTHPLPRPFMVLATQNPIEYEGTFPLPEAQLDRFLLRVRLGYPSASEEMRVLSEQQFRHPILDLKPVARLEDLLTAIEAIREIYVSQIIQRYIIDLVGRTRQSGDVYLGASPRGSLALFRASQARAALQGRDHVLPDDVQALAVPVLGHRVIVSPAARLRELSARSHRPGDRL